MSEKKLVPTITLTAMWQKLWRYHWSQCKNQSIWCFNNFARVGAQVGKDAIVFGHGKTIIGMYYCHFYSNYGTHSCIISSCLYWLTNYLPWTLTIRNISGLDKTVPYIQCSLYPWVHNMSQEREFQSGSFKQRLLRWGVLRASVHRT